MEDKCAVCSDVKEVRRHYGVICCYGCKAFFRRSINEGKKYSCANDEHCPIDKETRNRCRACRFSKCISVGMSESNLRDFRPKTAPDPPALKHLASTSVPSTAALTSQKNKTNGSSTQAPDQLLNHCLNIQASSATNEAVKLINFLCTMTTTNLEMYDPKYVNLTTKDWIEMELNFGRTVSLAEGLRNPEKVCPRTKMDYSATRKAEVFDMSFLWYRYFVLIADWANSIPQFRMLPEKDQVDLVKINFVNLSMVFMLLIISENGLMNPDILVMGNGSFISRDDHTNMLGNLVRQVMDVYELYLFKPCLELGVDSTELSILAAIRLFQYHENISPSGQLIAKQYLDKLYDALFEYQSIRFPDKLFLERARRQSKLLMIISRISQIYAMESDIHLMLSTFNGMNIEGIPKELLFNEFAVRERR